MVVEVVRRVLAVASGVGARALGETAQQRRHRRSVNRLGRDGYSKDTGADRVPQPAGHAVMQRR
eukprot:477121-Prymnesium_polylepis.1